MGGYLGVENQEGVIREDLGAQSQENSHGNTPNSSPTISASKRNGEDKQHQFGKGCARKGGLDHVSLNAFLDELERKKNHDEAPTNGKGANRNLSKGGMDPGRRGVKQASGELFYCG
jgi:hypothetical protein